MRSRSSGALRQAAGTEVSESRRGCGPSAAQRRRQRVRFCRSPKPDRAPPGRLLCAPQRRGGLAGGRARPGGDCRLCPAARSLPARSGQLKALEITPGGGRAPGGINGGGKTVQGRCRKPPEKGVCPPPRVSPPLPGRRSGPAGQREGPEGDSGSAVPWPGRRGRALPPASPAPGAPFPEARNGWGGEVPGAPSGQKSF